MQQSIPNISQEIYISFIPLWTDDRLIDRRREKVHYKVASILKNSRPPINRAAIKIR